MYRTPAVAGRFYSISPSALEEEVGGYIQQGLVKERVIAAILPHAGLIYSGRVAGMVYSRTILPERVVLVGPNHTARGRDVSVFPQGSWEMPNGHISIDAEFSNSLIERSRFAEADIDAHLYEHSLEVQLPFIQYFRTDFRIVPVIMMKNDLEVCKEIGEVLGDIISESKTPVLMIASTDMTHYEPDNEAREKDRLAIERILALDPVGLHAIIREKGITMCGYAPTVAVLFAALKLQARDAELVRYMTSGEVNRDLDHVVGYAGIIIR